MEITISSRKFKLDPELRDHAEKRISKFTRYLEPIQEAHLVLAQEKYRQIAEISIRAAGMDLVSREQTTDMASSIDRVCDRVERQIKKVAARMKTRKSATKTIPAGSLVAEDDLHDLEVEEEFAPVVVRTNRYVKELLTVEDAINHLRDRDWDFLMFQNSRSGKVAVVYHRDDGNFGLVEPE
ncbi:MAG: ribosome-associated translation inhibitor RaiA [Candidatus Eisenbacteria bacterium]|uniref:Ribosome-associated translation inhibitor RaiA n=1 Tax=Eiseniibacteriota bacterium TaxID=2212470 RepID=A0A956RQY7_UNCEI|nr:ribosome-associated translation inhibitor RaiA [Candidatus Eisenbacteria bacterium]